MGDRVMLRPWGDDDVDWWVESMLAWRPEWSGDELRQRAASGRYALRTVAEGPDGPRLGSATVLRPLGITSHLGLTLVVSPEHRGQGVGTALWRDLEPRVDGLHLLTGMPGSDDRALRSARRYGFDVVSVSIESELDLSIGALDPAPYPGIDVAVFLGRELESSGLDIDGLLSRAQTNPEATDLGWQFTVDEFLRMTPAPVWVVLLERGQPVAVALADESGRQRWDVYFTGVDPRERGRGLGRLVKQHLHVVAASRGARVIGTGNEERNVAVRALNASLGYVVVGTDVRLRRPGAAYDGRPLR